MSKGLMVKQRYVAGFMFSEDGKNVALIRKKRPEWQKGLLNAIGGKIEKCESPQEAMRREFEEETGCVAFFWKCFCRMQGEWGEAFFFSKKVKDKVLRELMTTENEKVEIKRVSDVHKLKIIPNLNWLIPMALDNTDVAAVITEGNETGKHLEVGVGDCEFSLAGIGRELDNKLEWIENRVDQISSNSQ